MTASYPTTEEIRELPGWDIDEEIGKLSSWETQPKILAEITADALTHPQAVFAWAVLAEALCEVHKTAQMQQYKVTRPLTREELVDMAETRAKNREYDKRVKASRDET